MSHILKLLHASCNGGVTFYRNIMNTDMWDYRYGFIALFKLIIFIFPRNVSFREYYVQCSNRMTECWPTTTWYEFTFGQYILVLYTYRQLCWERGNIYCVRPLGRMHVILVINMILNESSESQKYIWTGTTSSQQNVYISSFIDHQHFFFKFPDFPWFTQNCPIPWFFPAGHFLSILPVLPVLW